MRSSHVRPNHGRFGNDRIQEVLRGQRDVYAHLNDQVRLYANQGVTINEIQNVYQVPKGLQSSGLPQLSRRRAEQLARCHQRFLGHYNGKPLILFRFGGKVSAPLYVEMMGGSAKIVAKGKQLHDEGQYLHAQDFVNRLVQAEPQNKAARICWRIYSSNLDTSRSIQLSE